MPVAFRSQVPDPDCRQAFASLKKYLNDNHLPKNNFTATSNPTVNDDSLDGYERGSLWINTTLNRVYILEDPTAGAANWILLAPEGGSAPLNAKYIVQEAHADLSAEQSLGLLTTGLLKNTVTAAVGVLSTAIAGTDYGTISGSTGSTDNAVLRADGIGGSTLQNSAVLIDDLGNLIIPTNRRLDLRNSSSSLSSPASGELDIEAFTELELKTNALLVTDSAAAVVLRITRTGSGVNNLLFTNAIAGAPATIPITAQGASTDIHVNVIPKGTGRLQDNGSALIKETIFNAKGDLISATAADTPAILSVGAHANGEVLTLDSAEATGMKWAPAASSGHTIRENGTDQTARGALNFIDSDAGAGFLTDDLGNNETEVNLNLYGLLAGRASIQTWTAAQRISAANKWEFRDAGIFAHSDADGSLIVESDTTAWFKGLTTTKIGVNGNVQVGDGSTEIDLLPGGDRKANLGNASVKFEQGHIAELLHLYGISGTSSAAMRLDQQSAPSAPVDGDVWHDGTQNALFAFQSGLKTGLAGVIMTSEGTVCQNTTTETSVLGTVSLGTATLPANFGADAKLLHLHASGIISSKASAPGNLTLRFKKGSTNLVVTSTFAVTAGMSSADWSLDVYLQFTTSSSIEGHGWFLFFAGGQLGGQPFAKINNVTSASEPVDVTAQWSLADVANIFTVHQAFLETIG